MERMESGKKLESINQAKKKQLRLTVYANGFPSLEGVLNSLNFFIVEQQKSDDLSFSENPFACMLFNYFNIFKYFKCFKGATKPRHTYVCGFKHDSLWDET